MQDEVHDGPQQVITLNFNKDGVTAPAFRSARLASEIVAICSPAIASADPNNVAPGFKGTQFLHMMIPRTLESRISHGFLGSMKKWGVIRRPA